MHPSDDELSEELEMLPGHSGDVYRQSRQPNRRFTANCGITIFFSIIGIAIVSYLFWPGPGIPPPRPPRPQKDPGADILLPSHDPVWLNRSASVKDAFIHAYGGYEKYTTFPDDELRPISNSGQRNFNGWAVTVVDSLDTMWLMGLTSEFDKAVAQVATLDFTKSHNNAPFFETVIRYLGGLLSAYGLSGETILLARADELGRRLFPVFDSPSGMPHFSINVETGVSKDASDRPGRTVLAELGSCQLEYKYLSHVTGKQDYFQKPDHIVDLMRDAQQGTNGMWDIMWNISSGKQLNNHVGVAAAADSGYEYVLKQYLLTGKTETKLKDMFLKATSGVIENLLFLSPTRHLLYVSDIEHGRLTGKFEHLACFFPGLLALAAATLDLSKSDHELYMWAAEGLAHSCWIMYADQESGLGPELVRMDMWPGDSRRGRWVDHVDEWQRVGRPGNKPPGVRDLAPPVKAGEHKDYILEVGTYFSRPETLESMFVMWRTTGDIKWREHGWAIWDAIESKTRTSSGYASVEGVDRSDPYKIDSMPSYFLSETIKYAYLLAIDDDPWPVDKFVFNTEAHPLPIFQWRDWEKKRYGIV